MKKNLLLAFLSIVITVLVVDAVLRHPAIALRFFSSPSVYYYKRFPKIHKTLRHSSNIRLNAAVTGQLAWMLGNNEKQRKILFITDHLGFRNILDYRKEVFNTILLGDSFAFCAITDHHKLLSEQLNKKGHKVYNISTDGVNVWDEIVTLKYQVLNHLKLKNNSHIIWLLFEGNDLEGQFYVDLDPNRLINPKIREIGVSIENYYKQSLLKLMFKRLLRSREHQVKDSVIEKTFFGKPMLFFKPYADTLETTIEDIHNHENYQNVSRAFKSLAKFLKSKGFLLTCVVVPVKPRVYEWVFHDKKPWSSDTSQSPFSQYIKELCTINDVAFLDLTPIFIHASKTVYDKSSDATYWLDDTHWNDEGQAIAASVINEVLKKRN